MKLTSRPQPSELANIDDRIMPLINIVFLLLIFFLVAGVIKEVEPLEVEPPASTADVEAAPADLTLYISPEGRIALGDLRQSLVDLGCKPTISETKQFFRHLHDEEATVVDLAEYVEELTPDVALAIITALDDTEHAHRLAVQLERHEARLREMAGDQTNAATKLQNITRSRKARQTVAHKRYERSKKGQAEREGATALQSTFRARQSRLAAKAAAKKRLDTTAKRLLGDPAFQGVVGLAQLRLVLLADEVYQVSLH